MSVVNPENMIGEQPIRDNYVTLHRRYVHDSKHTFGNSIIDICLPKTSVHTQAKTTAFY